MLNPATITQQLDLLAAQCRTLAHLLEQAAVFDAYSWPHALGDDEILARLLALNLERAAGQGEVVVTIDERAGTDEDGEGK